MNKTQEKILTVKHLMERLYASLEDQFYREAKHAEASRSVMKHGKRAIEEVSHLYASYREQLQPAPAVSVLVPVASSPVRKVRHFYGVYTDGDRSVYVVFESFVDRLRWIAKDPDHRATTYSGEIVLSERLALLASLAENKVES